MVIDSFSKSPEDYAPDTVLGARDRFVNKNDQFPPLGGASIVVGSVEGGGKASSKISKKNFGV